MDTRLFRRISVILGGLFILGAACMEGAKAPSKSPNGALAPGASGDLGKKESGAFRVVFAGPQGEASEVSELSLVFSRPLRKLELAGAPPPPLSISPNTPGRWLWVGTHALHFVPETPHLLGSTRYVITVPAELRALDGATLGSAFHFDFTTPRPKLVDSEPSAGSRGLEPNTVFTLHFNQAIDADKFRSFTTLRAEHAGKAEALAFSVLRPDPSEPKRLEVRPARPLPLDARILLTTSEALTGLEGPLPVGAAIEIPVETYGPLSVVSVNCDRETPHGKCRPGGAWSLELSNAVTLKDLRRALSITPGVPLHFEDWTDESTPVSYLSIAAPFQAGRAYTIHVNGDLHDVHGQRLGKTYAEDLAIDDYFPAVEIGVTGALLDPRVATSLPIGSVNVPSYVLSSASLSAEDALRLSNESEPEQRWQLLRSLKSLQQRSVSPRAPTNRIGKESVDLGAILGDAKRGPLVLGVEYQRHPKDYRSPETFKIVKLTDLAITAKLSVDGSLVWVTRISNGEPVAKASLRVLGASGDHHYETDAQGIALIPARDFQPKLEEPGGDADSVLVAKSGDDWTYESVRDYLSPWRFSVPFDLSGKKQSYGLIFTERGIYRPGDDVQVKGIVRRELPSGKQNPAGDELELALYSPDAEEMQKQTVKLSRYGTFAAHLKVPETGHLGSWQVRAKSANEDCPLRVLRRFGVSAVGVQGGSRQRPTELRARRHRALDRTWRLPVRSAHGQGGRARYGVARTELLRGAARGGLCDDRCGVPRRSRRSLARLRSALFAEREARRAR